ncbi:MAG: tyrosine-type recombinase/integrase [Candidatus Aminicenantes bacterium]|nr:tyrosine-type recombinase/integrase [Candidatus Aminicenantes bacterium]
MGIYKVGKIWYIDYYANGQRIREAVGPIKTEAKAAFEARKGEIRMGKFHLKESKKPILFEKFAEEYMEYAKANKRSWVRDEISLKHLRPHFKGMALSKINPRHIEDYKRKRLDKVKPATINRELTLLKFMFSLARKWKYVNENPVKEVGFFQERQYLMRILDKEEIKRLITVASDPLRAMIILALNSGMRKGEIFNLRWSDVDFADSYIYIKESKSNLMRKVPMNTVVVATLKSIKRESDYVFPGPRTKGRYSDIFYPFKKACEKAGIKDMRFHDLRHSAATLMVMGGIDLVTIKEILGHSDIQMTMRYAHPTPENKIKAVNVLASVFESEQGEKTSHNMVIRPN